MAIFFGGSVTDAFDDIEGLKEGLRPTANHGDPVCDGGAGEHREGGCLVDQPTDSQSVTSPDGSLHTERNHLPSGSALVTATFEAKPDGEVTNEPAAMKALGAATFEAKPDGEVTNEPAAMKALGAATSDAKPDGEVTNKPAAMKTEAKGEASTSGYQSISATEKPKGDDPEPSTEESHNISPSSSFPGSDQQEDLAHGHLPTLDPHQDASTHHCIPNFLAAETDHFRRRGKTMPPAIKPFQSPDPGGGNDYLIIPEEPSTIETH